MRGDIVGVRPDMSLPKPYYEKDGITIYHADDVVYCQYGSLQRLQTNSGTYRKEEAFWGCAPFLAWGRCLRKVRAFESPASSPSSPMCSLRSGEGRTSPHRREHSQQRQFKYKVLVPAVPHGGGRTVGRISANSVSEPGDCERGAPEDAQADALPEGAPIRAAASLHKQTRVQMLQDVPE